MFRAFIGGEEKKTSLHSIFLQEIDESNGDKLFKAIFHLNDPLEWFDI